MNPPFKVGDPVSRISFRNCFNEQVAKVEGLTVAKVQEMPSDWIEKSYRIVATGERGWFEAPAWFFEAAPKGP